jgi:hypothetical protein
MFLKNKIVFIVIIFGLVNCDGTLGGFDTINFPISKKRLETAFDSLYSDYPEYKIPDKLKEYNFWSKSGYDFLESRLIYFDEFPEEMYYISFVGDEKVFKDSTHADIAIRSVFLCSKKKWLKEEDFNENEKTRIKNRFENEILLKLEKLTDCKSKELD